jgi:hypothetical protein
MSGKAVLGSVLVVATLLLATPEFAEAAPPPHRGPWPIRNGHNTQPTAQDLSAAHIEDVTPDQAREIDRLYDLLLPSGDDPRSRQGRRAR